MSSSRLPGKVLKPLAGAPMILRQIERVRRARLIDRLVVATSREASDDPLVEVLKAADVEVFRGPLDDVLGRFLAALEASPAEVVVRLTADCPLADPEVIDATIARRQETGADYVYDRLDPAGYPQGLDVEVITAEALRRVGREATAPDEREHVTWRVRQRPQDFKVAALRPAKDEREVRWTVDLPDDYAFVAAVYEALYPANPAFTSADVRALVGRRPELARLGGVRRL
jgi:spore coat polysaccharide biosynthesis protein SpsF